LANGYHSFFYNRKRQTKASNFMRAGLGALGPCHIMNACLASVCSFPCSALSPATWFAVRFLCLASVFFSCSALSVASWCAARFLCLASVYFPCPPLSAAGWCPTPAH